MEKRGQKDEKTGEKIQPSVKQEQIHDLLFSREIGWQEIIYDLINTEQLDPWNINIITLTNKYLERVKGLEEADFFVSSKVLLAAALLLRIKSEILLNKYIKSIDDILFGRKEDKKYEMERIELDEFIPELVPKSPMPRFKRVTLQELMESLNKAIITENRRIKKEIVNKNALREVGISLPKRKFNITDRIRELYDKLVDYFSKDKNKTKISFTDFVGTKKDDMVVSFPPLLHLDHQNKVWLTQDSHFNDFDIWMNDAYFANNPDPYAELKKELEEQIENLDEEQEKRLYEINEKYDNPLGEIVE